MFFNKKIILFYPLLKQFEKQTADPKTADIMPRAKNAETADRQSLINLDAVQNYDEKKGIAYFDQGVAHSVAVRRRRSVMLKLNATKNDLA